MYKNLKIKIVLFIFFSALISPNAHGGSLDEIKKLFTMGRFEEARTEAVKMNTAEGYAIASESLLAQILLGEVGKLFVIISACKIASQNNLSFSGNNFQEIIGNGSIWLTNRQESAFKQIQTVRMDITRNVQFM